MNNKLHNTIQDTFEPAYLQGTTSWAVFYYMDNRVTITKASKGFRINVGGIEIWKSSAKAACNWVAKNF